MISIDLSRNWRLYTNTIPPGSRALGTVTRDGYDTGALVLIEATGLYVQANAGAVRNLDQRKVSEALCPKMLCVITGDSERHQIPQ